MAKDRIEKFDTISKEAIETIKEFNKALVEVRNSVEMLKKESKGLSKEFKNIKANNSGAELNNLKKTTEELNKNTRKLTEAEKEAQRIEKARARQVEKVAQAYSEANIELVEGRLKLAKLNRDIKDGIRLDKEKAGSINKIEAELRLARRQYTAMSKAERETTKAGKDLLKNINQLSAEQNKLRRSIGQAYQDVGKYEIALGKLRGVFTKAGGIIALVAGFGAALVGLGKKISATSRIQNRLRFAFGATGDELTRQTALAQTLADVYDKDVNEVIKSANSLSKQFGISGTEALNQIAEGFEKGADNSGEFLDTIKEYSTQIKSAGLDSEEFISIVTQNVRSGIFSDKGIDSIKEALIRIREMTPATKAALDGIGLASDEIQKSLQDGTKSTFDIIREVSERLNELGDNAPQIGTAIADIFGGAGEDAGLDYLKTLKDIKTELDLLPAQTNEFAKATKNLTSEWNLFTASIFEGEGFLGQLGTDLQNLIADIIGGARQLSNFGVSAVSEADNILDEYNQNIEKSIDKTIQRIDTLNSSLSKLDKQIRKADAEGDTVLSENLGTDALVVIETIGELEEALRVLNDDALSDNIDLTDQTIQRLIDFGIREREVKEEIEDTNKSIKKQNETIEDEKEVVERKVVALDKLISKESKLGEEIKQSEDAFIKQSKAIFDNTQTTVINEEARDKAISALIKQGEFLRTLDDIEQFSQAAGQAAQFVSDNFIDGFARIKEANISLTDSLIEESQTRIDSLTEFLELQIEREQVGLASTVDRTQQEIAAEREKNEVLRAERNKALKEQQRITQAQTILDSVQQASSLATAAAKIFESLSALGPIGVGIAGVAIASLFASFIGFKAKATAEAGNIPEFFDGGLYDSEGGYTGDGNIRHESKKAGNKPYIYHKKEFIMPHEQTEKYRGFLELMYDNKFTPTVDLSENIRTFDLSGMADNYRLEQKMDEFIIGQNRFINLMSKQPQKINGGIKIGNTKYLGGS